MPPAPPTVKEIVGLSSFLLSFAFSATVAADHAGYISVLDPEYRANGFCIAEHKTHGFNSYQMCFIVDTLACAILLSMKGARQYLTHTCSIFLHGTFHLLQYLFGWPHMPPALHVVAYTMFTLAFMAEFGVGWKWGSKKALALGTTAIVGIEFHLVPHPMTFAFTNFWIFLIGTGAGIFTPKAKRDSYGQPRAATFLLFLGGACFPFCEAILCNAGIKDLGGHAIFDASFAAIALISLAMDAGSDAKAKSS